MSIAEELRTAAAKLREAADGTTPGSWRYHDTHLGHLGGHTATVLAGEHNDTKLVAWLPSRSQEPWADHPCWADSRWIARAHPALAEPLAAALDEVAAFVGDYPDLGREHVDGEPCDDYACGIVTRLRAVAHAIASPAAPAQDVEIPA